MSISPLTTAAKYLIPGAAATYAVVKIVPRWIARSVGGAFAEVGTEVLEELATGAGDASKILGKKAAEGLGIFMKEAGKYTAEAFKEMNFALSWSTLRAWGPTMVALGAITTGLPLVYGYAAKVLENRIGKPALLLDSKTTRWYSSVMNFFWRKANKTEVRPIFKPELQEQVQDVIAATRNIEKNDGYFENVLLYGPPGTGKTMIAKQIAAESGLDYYMTSAAEMTQYIKRGEHVHEMNKLLDQAEKSGKPALLFFDEFESIGRDRGRLDQAHLELQTTLLKRTGEGSKRVMLAFATNRKDDLDPAIISRAAYKIYVGLPDVLERQRIINLYTVKFFSPDEIRQFFTPSTVQQIATKIHGFSGRMIFQMISAINNKKFTTPDGKLTQKIIDQKIEQFVNQEREVNQTGAASRLSSAAEGYEGQ